MWGEHPLGGRQNPALYGHCNYICRYKTTEKNANDRKLIAHPVVQSILIDRLTL